MLKSKILGSNDISSSLIDALNMLLNCRGEDTYENFGVGTFGRRRFGDAVLAPPFWRRRFGASRFGAGHFGAAGWRRTLWRRGLAPDTLAPRVGARHFGARQFFFSVQTYPKRDGS